MSKNNRTLYIPDNVRTENEIWLGLSVKSALLAGGVTLVAAILIIVIGMALSVGEMNIMLAILVVAAISIGIQTKLPNNLSIVDIIKILIKFTKEQKRFKYMYRR